MSCRLILVLKLGLWFNYGLHKYSITKVCVSICTLQFSLIAQALLSAMHLQMAHVPLHTVRSNSHPYSATPAMLL